MKNRIIFSAAAIVFLSLSFASCTKEEAFTPITLTGVTTISDQNTLISEAALGDFIAIHGTGLDKKNITSIRIDDVEVDLSQIYTENSVLFVKIPVVLAMEVTDKIYITNDKGTQTIPFHTTAPDLVLDRMFNEYTAPGDTMMIYGQFFNLYEINSENGVVYFGDKQSPVIESSDTYLKAVVPADVKKNIKVKVVGTKHSVESTCPGYYYDNRCIIMDFDTILPRADYTEKYVVTNPNDDCRLSGAFLRFDSSTWSGWWYIAETTGTVAFTDEMLDNAENYEIKMEFRSSNTFSAGKLIFHTYLYWNAPTIDWDASSLNLQSLNRWETVTIPFVVNRNSQYPGNEYYRSFNTRVDAVEGFPFSVCIDNIRLSKKGE